MENGSSKLIKETTEIVKLLELTGAVLKMFEVRELPFLLCFFDVNTFDFIKMSKSSEALLGYPPAEMEGKNLNSFVNDEDYARGRQVVAATKEGAPAPQFHINSYRKKDGTLLRLIWFVNEYKHENIRRTFCIGIPLDEIARYLKLKK